jgi:protein TonB
MMPLGAEEIADLRRWSICAAIIVLAHGGIAAAMVRWSEPSDGMGSAAGIVIEFAPLPVAPAVLQSEAPPGPEQDVSDINSMPVQSDEKREKVEQKQEAKLDQKVEEQVNAKPVEQSPPDLKPAPNSEIAIPLPPQEVKQDTPQPQEAHQPATPTMPEVIAEQTAMLPAAPRQGPPNPYESEAARTWTSQILASLLRNKRYPPAARDRGDQGLAQVFMSLDRRGHMIESRLVRSSGVAQLDQEALALLRRSQPFPPPPPEWPGDPVNLVVPIRFNVK